MFSSSKWISRVINTQLITIIFHLLMFYLFQDLLSSSSCNTNISTFTILANPEAIHPKTKHASRKRILTDTPPPSINSFFTHSPWHTFHFLFPFYNAHYHLLFISIYPSQCFYLSIPHTVICSPISYQFSLTYLSTALTFSLLLCLSISASPWALSSPCTPTSENTKRA